MSQKETTRGQRIAIDLLGKAASIDDFWQQRVIVEMNDYQFKVARVEGDFIWHSHADTDETFIVLEGELRIDFREGAMTLRAGELGIVPKGVEHKPYAKEEKDSADRTAWCRQHRRHTKRAHGAE